MPEANENSNAHDLADMLEDMVLAFRNVLKDEMSEICEQLEENEAGVEERLKAFTGLFKMIQGIELVNKGIRQQREQEFGREVEVVEFRRQLERQIARLVDPEAAQTVSGQSQ